MIAELLTNTQNDDFIVDVARVSFAKQADNYTAEQNRRLINYLAKHHHISPFFHVRETFYLPDLNFKRLDYTDMAGMVWDDEGFIRTSVYGWVNLIRKFVNNPALNAVHVILSHKYPNTFAAFKSSLPDQWDSLDYNVLKEQTFVPDDFKDFSFRITTPIFNARQDFKHQIGFARNEVSRRYVDGAPEFWIPDVWRDRAENKKQGSGDGEVLMLNESDDIRAAYRTSLQDAVDLYSDMLAANVAPEQARMVLPQSMSTQYITTGNLDAWKRAYWLRTGEGAQEEISELYKSIGEQLGLGKKDDAS